MPPPLAVTLAHARLLAEAVTEGDVTVPSSASEAYDAQDQLTSLLDTPVVGWKVGATSEVVQERLGVKAPIAGRVHEKTLLVDGGTVDATAFVHRPGIECEFALRTKTDLAPGSGRVDVDAARALVGSVHPALELVETRYAANFGVPPALLVADGSAHAALIIGAGVDPERAGDLSTAELRLVVDGAQVTSGTGAEVLGDPYVSLAWLCNHLLARGQGLPAGSIVSTGSCTGIVPSEPDQQIVTDAGPLGTVSIHVRG